MLKQGGISLLTIPSAAASINDSSKLHVSSCTFTMNSSSYPSHGFLNVICRGKEATFTTWSVFIVLLKVSPIKIFSHYIGTHVTSMANIMLKFASNVAKLCILTEKPMRDGVFMTQLRTIHRSSV